MSAKMIRIASALAVAIAATTWAAPSASAQTTTYTLSKVSTDLATNVGGQLFVDVVYVSDTEIDFVFRNEGPIASSITDIYFDDGDFLDNLAVQAYSGTVSFSPGASPPDFGGPNSVNFVTSQGLSADSNSGPPGVSANGVNPNESLTLRFDLINGETYATVNHAMGLALADPNKDVDGYIRIGAHVQSIAPTGGSSWYINGNPVPEPSSLAIAGLGALGMIGYGLRRRRAQA